MCIGQIGCQCPPYSILESLDGIQTSGFQCGIESASRLARWLSSVVERLSDAWTVGCDEGRDLIRSEGVVGLNDSSVQSPLAITK